MKKIVVFTPFYFHELFVNVLVKSKNVYCATANDKSVDEKSIYNYRYQIVEDKILNR